MKVSQGYCEKSTHPRPTASKWQSPDLTQESRLRLYTLSNEVMGGEAVYTERRSARCDNCRHLPPELVGWTGADAVRLPLVGERSVLCALRGVYGLAFLLLCSLAVVKAELERWGTGGAAQITVCPGSFNSPPIAHPCGVPAAQRNQTVTLSPHHG